MSVFLRKIAIMLPKMPEKQEKPWTFPLSFQILSLRKTAIKDRIFVSICQHRGLYHFPLSVRGVK